MYIVYRCRTCRKHFLLLVEEVEYSEKESKYITCPYHGKHKHIEVCGRYDNLKKCMDNHVYVREGRRMRQVK